jgi:hypothetical protein
MAYLRVFGRIALWTCVSLVSLILLAAMAARTERYVLRHRAVALLADMQSITLRKTTFHDVQPIMLRWRRWGTYNGPCSEAHCSFAIDLSKFDLTYQHRPVSAVAAFLRKPPTAIRADFTVVDGVVWDEWIGFAIETQGRSPDGRRYVDLIAGSARTVPKLDMGWGPHWHLHPDYNIYWAANQQNQIQLEFSPYANSTDIHRLMAFNFSCLTRFDPCQDKKDIMPVALAERVHWDSLPDDPMAGDSECDDPLTIEIFGRDSHNIVVAKVRDERVMFDAPEIGSRGYDMTVTLQHALKTHAHWRNQTPLKLSISYPISVAVPQPGSSVILFFKDDSFVNYSLAGCSPLPLNPAHLDAVRRGIAEDTRPSTLTD